MNLERAPTFSKVLVQQQLFDHNRIVTIKTLWQTLSAHNMEDELKFGWHCELYIY